MATFTHPSWPQAIDLTTNRGLASVKIPARFDFIGGWTDTPPYFFTRPAAVLNSTIELTPFGESASPADRAITVTVGEAKSLTIFENGQAVADHGEHPVLTQVLNFLGLNEPKIKVEINNTIPRGSGLGGSSLLAAGILTAIISYYRGADATAQTMREIIDGVLVIEQLMTSGGGWQDQIGGLLPGIKLITTEPGYHYTYQVRYSQTGADQLSERSLIVNTDVQRKASFILYSIRDKCLQEDAAALEVMTLITGNAKAGFDRLNSGDIEGFARLYGESWQRVNAVESKSSIELVDQIVKECGQGLWGYKIGGAGGGGFILLTFSDVEAKKEAAAKIKALLPDCQLFDPQFGRPGVQITQAGQTITPGEIESL